MAIGVSTWKSIEHIKFRFITSSQNHETVNSKLYVWITEFEIFHKTTTIVWLKNVILPMCGTFPPIQLLWQAWNLLLCFRGLQINAFHKLSTKK